ncbi:MAG: YraN family protein [Porticoccaceae bacterium]|nr:YraN family protein [Porticoccaceae bacterium]HLS99317.1 YraN family protein [Porticoccaceae bacterium]
MKLPFARRDKVSPGDAAEAAARDFLKARGLAILASNFRARQGEIDIIAREGDTLVFAEVRLRADHRFGDGAASIDPRKQQRLARTAAHYLATEVRGPEPPCRFDALSLHPAPGQSPPFHVEWIRDAFRPGF